MTELDEELRGRLAVYVRERFAPEDDVLAALTRRAAELAEGGMQITADVGRLLQVVAVSVGARRALELGTFLGYSAIWIGRALPADGELLTVDADPARAEEARRWIAEAQVPARVEVLIAAALDALATLQGGPRFDFVFVDARKEEYPAYLDGVLPLIRPGGVLVADNVLFSGSREGTVADGETDSPHLRGVGEFNRRIAGHPGLVSTILPIREGVSISVVTG